MTDNEEIIRKGFELTKKRNKKQAEYEKASENLNKQIKVNNVLSVDNVDEIQRLMALENRAHIEYEDAKSKYREFMAQHGDTFQL